MGMQLRGGLVIFVMFFCFIMHLNVRAMNNPAPLVQSYDKKTIVGGVLAGLGLGYAVYKVGQWWRGESDARVLQRAQFTYDNVLPLMSWLSVLERGYAIKVDDIHGNDVIFSTVNEQVLAQLYELLAQFSYSSDLVVNEIGWLQESFKKLDQCIHYSSSRSFRTAAQNDIFLQMNSLKNHIDAILPQLSLLKKYMDIHYGYFALCKQEKAINNLFKAEIALIMPTPMHEAWPMNQSSGYHDVLMNNLKEYVIGHTQGSYPLVAFVEKIDTSMIKLESCLKDVKYVYPQLLSQVARMQDVLALMKRVIVNDPRYVQELPLFQMEEKYKAKLAQKEREMNAKLRMYQEQIDELKRQAFAYRWQPHYYPVQQIYY